MSNAKKKYLEMISRDYGRGLAKGDYDDDDFAVFALLDTEDADDTLQEHDDKFHNPNHEEHGHFDPETMSCGLRDKLEKKDGGDDLSGAKKAKPLGSQLVALQKPGRYSEPQLI